MELLTADEAAAYLKIHPETLRRKTRARQVPAWRIGPFWRYRREVLDEWMAQGCPSQVEQPSLFDEPGA
ncbi:MAG: helix-turn-helix domain-containing protein [Acidobacteriota bacterium]|nr:helix-turn-helix domain-containing protein [Acidobacteriota bacterium]